MPGLHHVGSPLDSHHRPPYNPAMNMTPSQIIDAFGGTTKVAALCQIRTPSVSEWKRTGIPKARLLYLKLLRPDLFPGAETDPSANPFAIE